MTESATAGRGILLFSTAILLFSIMDVFAKWLMDYYEPFMVVWARYASQMFWTLILFAPRLRRLLRTRHLGLQLLRSAFLFGGTATFFMSLSYLKLAEAVAIFEVGPLLITAFSVLILKEVVGIRRWLGVMVGMCGALIIIRPGTEVFQPASLLPILAAINFAAYTIATRFLGKDEPPATSFLYTTLIGTIAASLILPTVWTTPQMQHVPYLATFGVIGGIGHYLLIVAFTATPASVLAPFSYLGLVFSAIWGLLIFSEFPDIWTWAGATVIIGAGLYVWYRENYATAPVTVTQAPEPPGSARDAPPE